METARERVMKRLSEIRSRHTGRDPFGPWTDLKQLHADLLGEERTEFLKLLRELQQDSFWRDFISLLRKSVDDLD